MKQVIIFKKEQYGKTLTKIELRIVPSINSSNICVINENTEITVKEIINKWSYIETKDYSGWIN